MPIPFRSASIVPQAEIEFLLGVENEIRELNRIYDEHAAEVLRLRRAGASVEPGAHTVHIKEIHQGPAVSYRLVLA